MVRTLALLALAIALPSAHAVDLKSLKPQGYCSDFAGVVDAESRAAIEHYAAAVEHSTGAQISLVTLRTLDGEPLEDVGIDLFRQFGVGQKNKDNGVQLLLVVDDRRSRLDVGHGLEAVLPDGLDGQILLDMRPELRAGHYGQALLAAAERLGQTIAQAQGVSITMPPGVEKVRAQPSQDRGLPWPVILFLVFIVVMMMRRGSGGGRGGGGGLLSGLLLGNMMGRGWGRGGGGFGGFDDGGGGSSGGFGGFGGGDAGGGGASSSW